MTSRYLLVNDYDPMTMMYDAPPSAQDRQSATELLTRDQVHDLARTVFASRPMPDFANLTPAPGLCVTAVFQGTAQVFNEQRNISQLALKAALAKHRVFAVNGIGTQTNQDQIIEFQQKTQGRGRLLASYGNDAHTIKRQWSQALSGQVMLENALALIKEIRGLGVIPKRIDAAGYSRGGVSATLMVTLLDFLLDIAGIRDSDKPEIRLALFDPVASLHACSEYLVSRDVLGTNPNIQEGGVFVFASLDLFRRFHPQAGNAGAKEVLRVLPSNHQGLEGADQRKHHHRAAARMAQFLSLKHFGLDVSADEDLQLIKASLKISAIQQDMALRLRWSAVSEQKRRNLNYWLLRLAWNDKQFRAEGEALLRDLKLYKDHPRYLFIDPCVERLFAEHFPAFNQIVSAYFEAKTIEHRANALQAFEQRIAPLGNQGLAHAILSDVSERLNQHFHRYRTGLLRESRLEKMKRS